MVKIRPDRLIGEVRSPIFAADTTLPKACAIVEKTSDLLGAVKVGALLGYSKTPRRVADCMRQVMADSVPLIFDHQKWPTDIPDISVQIAELIYSAGFDAIIMFPESGSATQQACHDYCKDVGFRVLAGGHMTHKKYRAEDGGYITRIDEMFKLAAANGVKEFIVPGNQPDWIEHYRTLLETQLGRGKFDLAGPGFGVEYQGGNVGQAAERAGESIHVIAGSLFTKKAVEEARKTALQIRAELGMPIAAA